MPLSEYDGEEALGVAADWLTASELSGDRRKARARRAGCRYATGRATVPTQGSGKGCIRSRPSKPSRCRAMNRFDRRSRELACCGAGRVIGALVFEINMA